MRPLIEEHGNVEAKHETEESEMKQISSVRGAYDSGLFARLDKEKSLFAFTCASAPRHFLDSPFLFNLICLKTSESRLSQVAMKTIPYRP